MFELLIQLALEVVGQLLFEFAVTLGWESPKHGVFKEGPATPMLAGVGQFLAGVGA